MTTRLLLHVLKIFQPLADFLIESSVWVIACILALAIWTSLMLRSHVDIPGLLSFALFLFQIYWLDRSRAPQEDSPSREQRPSPSLFILKYRLLHSYFIGATLLAQGLLFIRYPRLFISYVLALFVTVFYVLPLPALGKRIKEFPYAKNVYAPAAFTFCLFIFSEHLFSKENAWVFLIVNFFLSAANSALFDMKDIEGDRRAGLRLISTCADPGTVFKSLIIFNFLCALSFLVLLPPMMGIPVTAAFVAQGSVACCMAWRFSKRGLMFFADGVLFVPLLVYWLCQKAEFLQVVSR